MNTTQLYFQLSTMKKQSNFQRYLNCSCSPQRFLLCHSIRALDWELDPCTHCIKKAVVCHSWKRFKNVIAVHTIDKIILIQGIKVDDKPLLYIKNSAFIYVILWKNNYIPFLKNTGDNEIKKWEFDNVCRTSFEQFSLLRRTVQ